MVEYKDEEVLSQKNFFKLDQWAPQLKNHFEIFLFKNQQCWSWVMKMYNITKL